jgi:SpoVK/Ycf46/Vps4 family AAA+-type ATPase
LIVIAEDIGGVEVDEVRIKSESSLLSLLDNQEKAFRIPTLIIPTTNYPENLLANIANRPKRVDRKIKFDFPTPEERKQLLKFYDVDNVADEKILAYLAKKEFSEFTPAHISEIFLRSDLEDMTLKESIDSIQEEIKYFNQLFQEKVKMGIAVKNDYD